MTTGGGAVVIGDNPSGVELSNNELLPLHKQTHFSVAAQGARSFGYAVPHGHWVIWAKARHQVIMSLKKRITNTSKAMIR
jgi:hypothetical protein